MYFEVALKYFKSARRRLLRFPTYSKYFIMLTAILVHPDFDAIWPFAADHAHHLCRAQGAGEVEFHRLAPDDRRSVGEVLSQPAQVTRLLAFEVPVTQNCVDNLTQLREISGVHDAATAEQLQARGVRVIRHKSEGYWGQSVAEFGLALTLCGLRRIPQTHHEIISSQAAWDYEPPNGTGAPGARGQQFGDDTNFSSGTIEGKRIRIVGAGNIASRYASFVKFLGADVASWDPFASEPCFHRAGARREHFLDRLVQDAEIFAPMVPLTDKTRGLVTASHIEALPMGCLVVVVTRAGICDVPALRRRVLNDELSLAADVFDVEPLPLDDPLLGRHNVVHTPHNAGRTRQSNERFAALLMEQFEPV